VGVSDLVLASTELFTALKLIGATYLAWLGVRTIVAARRDALAAAAGLAAAPPVGMRRARSTRACWWRR
jgi:threonine/homoserine/homoserine lactone efflux protein